mmetsp:Transcript_27893/g.52181  ORF Transcript_27893/g.52181 Transcript_27893/m.52181 type:complete len:114 (+) Transcript_27893:1381-1722(+)
MSWVIMNTVCSVPLQILSSSSWMVPRVSASSAPKGSSSSNSLGWLAKARAMDTRCRMPPESWLGLRCTTSPSRPTLARKSRAWSSTLSRDQSGCRALTPKVTFLRAESHGKSE